MRDRRLLVTLACLAATIAACGGGDGEVQSTAAAALGVALTAPPGWFASDDGLTVAANRSDLVGETATGPRIRVLQARESDQTGADLVEEYSGVDVDVVAQPERVSVDGRSGVAVTLRESEPETDSHVVRRYIAITGAKGIAVLFVLEAPPDAFDSNVAEMTRALGWTE